jgi:hypothetical protein
MREVRTWKCPDCGATTEVSYDCLAESGGPICGACDCDMELQPESHNGDLTDEEGQP